MSAAGARRCPWGWAATAVALVVSAWVGYFVLRMPLQVSDNLGNLLTLRHATLGELVAAYFGNGPYLRPLLWGTFKVVFDLSGGHYHLAFKGLQVMQVAALLVLAVRLLRVRAAGDAALVPLLLMVLIGHHTFIGFVFETYPVNAFLTIALCCVMAMTFAESRGGRVIDAAALITLGYAMFMLESGLLVWVVLAAAYGAGARGVSRAGLAGATAMVAAYFAIRFVFLDGGTPALAERATGWFGQVLEPAELEARFGANPLPLYLHNVAAAILGVLFSEPRGGVSQILRLQAEGRPMSMFVLLNVTTSVALTTLLAAFTIARGSAWLRGRIAPRERLVVVFWVLLAANSVISYAYVKDQIVGPAGVFYALACAAAAGWFVSLDWRARRPAVAVWAAVAVLAVSAGWTLRATGLAYYLTRTAYLQRAEWIDVEDWVRDQRITLRDGDLEFIRARRAEALATPVPHPAFVYRTYGRTLD